MPKESTPFTLDQQLCFALYSTSLAMTQLYKNLLEPLGLTYTQYLVMLILWESDGVTLKTIAQRLGQQSGALTPVIKRMEADGLIMRVRGKEDDRSLSIELTEKGEKLRQKATDVMNCIKDASNLSYDEIGNLRGQLLDLKEQITKNIDS